MTLAGRASGICLQPWLPGLSSCVAAMMDVTAADGSEIPMTTLTSLGAGNLSSLGGYW